jgi:hypothetical protein
MLLDGWQVRREIKALQRVARAPILWRSPKNEPDMVDASRVAAYRFFSVCVIEIRRRVEHAASAAKDFI